MSDTKINVELLICGDAIDQRTPEEVATTRPWNNVERPSVYRIAVDPGVSFMLAGLHYIYNRETEKVERL